MFAWVHGQCPICASPIAKEEGEADWRCTGGITCPAQCKQAFLHFASRRAVEIEGLGDKVVDQLVDAGIVRTLPELYKLGFAKLNELERMGEKSAQQPARRDRAQQGDDAAALPVRAGHPPRRRGHVQGRWRGTSATSTS